MAKRWEMQTLPCKGSRPQRLAFRYFSAGRSSSAMQNPTKITLGETIARDAISSPSAAKAQRMLFLPKTCIAPSGPPWYICARTTVARWIDFAWYAVTDFYIHVPALFAEPQHNFKFVCVVKFRVRGHARGP